ncbi:MAG: hypothetical protein ABI275_10630 [Terrimesophilobacter sp.]
MPDEQTFDPRFNPAFQRGFDATAERTRRAKVTPSLTPDDVVYGRSARPDLAPPPPPPEDEAVDPAATTVEVPSPDTSRDRRNPFVWALWGLSAVLVLGGLGLFVGPGQKLFSGADNPGQATFALLQSLYVICPAMITVGLATVSALLFWHAAAWRRVHH